MKLNRLLILLIFVWTISGCIDNSYPYQEGVNEYFMSIGLGLESKQKILIVPNQNCETCIRDVLDLCVSGNCNNINKVILTKTQTIT